MGGGTYDIGSTVPITEAASAGYRVNGWSGLDAGSIASPASASTTIVMNANRNITPSFMRQFALTINVTAGGTASGSGTYDTGTAVPIVETAGTGFRANGWSGPDAGTAAAPSNPSTTIVMTANKTLSTSFVQQGVLTVTSGAGGTASGSGTYDIGSIVPITATPADHSAFTGWSGAGISNPNAASATVTITGNETVTADFSGTHTLAIAGAPIAGGTYSGAGTYLAGTVVSISETAGNGYRAAGWSGPDAGSTASAASPSTTIVMDSDKNLTAAFIQQVTLTVAAGPGGTATGAGTYDIGTAVPISETAASGYRAAGWSGPDAGSIASASSPSSTIVLNGNAAISANFVQQVSLTVAAGAGGTATGGGTYDIGSTVPIAATPASGYAFTDWTGTGPASMTSGSTTITLSGDAVVTANFTPQPPIALINAAATAYTGSPFTVTSTASAPAANLTLHSIEWLAPSGAWTVDAVAATGGSSNRTLGISFAAAGIYTLRAGASVDNGVTWVYSPSVPVTVSSGVTTYTLQTMAVPGANALTWYAPSPVVQKTYQVKHVNP